ncbi:hypothetical protein BHM03_00035771 [Ensete ventricosum]|nr:hypothetical protein BHM03_00035771 [Ensete ventricosum]
MGQFHECNAFNPSSYYMDLIPFNENLLGILECYGVPLFEKVKGCSEWLSSCPHEAPAPAATFTPHPTPPTPRGEAPREVLRGEGGTSVGLGLGQGMSPSSPKNGGPPGVVGGGAA